MDGNPGIVERHARMLEARPLRQDERFVLQVSRWDSLKDPLGVIDGFVGSVAPHTDAHLIYVENDEDVSADGTSVRWGYLFYSPGRAKARGYSVRNGKILEATDLAFDFDAPPLAEDWIDSQAANSQPRP